MGNLVFEINQKGKEKIRTLKLIKTNPPLQIFSRKFLTPRKRFKKLI